MSDRQAEGFTHLDASGHPSMVNVSEKRTTHRMAKAKSIVRINEEILSHFEKEDIQTAKGPVFQTAIIAGIMAAKKTGDLIPLCHPLGLENVQIDISLQKNLEVHIYCTANIYAKTGVEMEALMGATIAALTIYDMCKAFSHDIRIKETYLVEKRGGKRDFSRKEE